MDLDESGDSGKGKGPLGGRNSNTVRPDPMTSVLKSIKGFADARKAREQELQQFQRFRHAVEDAGYSEARYFLADQVGYSACSDVQDEQSIQPS